jgi:HAD superfamily hydrolase (TIGR01490 family)
MQLALFDFDGTITSRDSLIHFIRYAAGDTKVALGMAALSPMLLAYKLGLIPNDQAKQSMLGHFFRGISSKQFQQLAREYSLDKIDTILRPQAMERIEWHKEQGHDVVIVSASIECWLRPWCDKNGLELIATRMEIKNQVVTGKFSTKNCHGQEKVNRVKECYKLDDYECIYAYGDSRGDRELLALADESHYKPFRHP